MNYSINITWHTFAHMNKVQTKLKCIANVSLDEILTLPSTKNVF